MTTALSQQVGEDLADALDELEKARQNLVAAPLEEVGARAYEWHQAKLAALDAAAASWEEYAAVTGTTPPAPEPPPEPAPTEASPAVALFQPPGVLVTTENLDSLGPLAFYKGKAIPEGDPQPPPPIEATQYAFAPGTAVQTGEGEVATTQPSRIIRTGPGGALGVVPNDVFLASYERSAPPAPTSEGAAPSPAPAEETPAEPAAEGGAPPATPAAEG